MRHLNIDLETYSSAEIGKTGLYKYAQSYDFEVLLLAYSLDSAPPVVIDLAQGEHLPDELLRLLFDPVVIKHAYNAAFEWYCLSIYFRLSTAAMTDWLAQWQDTMLHGLYCGFPAGLAAIGNALGLAEDKQKLSTGKALIRYFCIPCKPTQVNSGRLRNLPYHDPDRWQLFREYNAQDVVTEQEIARRLAGFPVPQAVQEQWVQDLTINLRGVAIDPGLMEGALALSDRITQRLTQEAAALTGLENPNSLAQLKSWLAGADIEVDNLRKDTVRQLLGRELPDEAVRRVLEIRGELGKTSCKKYQAMRAAVCDDGRIRGTLQFYAGNRTGRWAGRIIQPQNLPRTYLEPLDLARQYVKDGNEDMLHFCWGSVQDSLSQLIRTALVPAPGNLFVDADFSAIEARVLSWLAGEEWRLEVFRTHGKIYEASASQMFGVPVDCIRKGNPEYALRQKGKIAELALGYQGSTGALLKMGALDMGLTEEELPDIVARWRQTNKRIVDFWHSMDAAAIEAIRSGGQVGVGCLLLTKECDPDNNLDFLTILLPSGRKLYYAYPSLVKNQWGRDSIAFWGVDQNSKKWGRQDTYGGKLVENVTQAIARDCLAVSIARLEAAGYPIVIHVHDEVVIDLSKDRADLENVCTIMGTPIPWAAGLPLNADGWVGNYYRKD